MSGPFKKKFSQLHKSNIEINNRIKIDIKNYELHCVILFLDNKQKFGIEKKKALNFFFNEQSES